MALIRVNCPHCQQHQGGSKNGKAPTGIQRFLCNCCHHSFQLEYIYNGNKPDTHEKIIEMAINFRTRIKRLARKTIWFSRSEEIHDKVIGELIEREHFQRF